MNAQIPSQRRCKKFHERGTGCTTSISFMRHAHVRYARHCDGRKTTDSLLRACTSTNNMNKKTDWTDCRQSHHRDTGEKENDGVRTSTFDTTYATWRAHNLVSNESVRDHNLHKLLAVPRTCLVLPSLPNMNFNETWLTAVVDSTIHPSIILRDSRPSLPILYLVRTTEGCYS